MPTARAEWARLDEQKAKVETFSVTDPGAGRLRSVWIFVHNCVSCSDSFARDCAEAQEDLDEAGKQLDAAFRDSAKRTSEPQTPTTNNEGHEPTGLATDSAATSASSECVPPFEIVDGRKKYKLACIK